MTTHTPSITILLHKRRRTIERISALRAEEVSHVPLRATRDNHLAFNRCFATLAARAEELVEVEVAVKSQRFVAVCHLELEGLICTHIVGPWDASSKSPRSYALDVFGSLLLWFGIEGDEFEVGVAFVADEAFWVEAFACCTEDAAGDG
jgi:hypothetical protein